MTPTLFGLLLAPPTLLVALLRPGWLAALLVVVSVFEGAAVLSTGSFGLTPYYFVALVVAARLVVLIARRRVRFPADGWHVAHLGFLLAFAAWGAASAVVLPRLFAGIPVLAPRGGIDTELLAGGTPLAFSLSNVAQVGYLLLNVAVVITLAQAGREPAGFRRLERAFLASGALVVAVALYQAVALRLGLPFPSDLLYSNPFRAQLFGVTSGGVPRINATFAESSNLALFGSALLAYVLVRYLLAPRRRALRHGPLIALLLAVLYLSTSSTAYLGVAGLVSAIALVFGVVPVVFQGRVLTRLLAVLLVSVGLLGASVAVAPKLRATLYRATVGKTTSDSALARVGADRAALELVAETRGLGVGLGSNRPSSFVTWLLSNTGVLGLVLFGGAVATLAATLLLAPAPSTVRIPVLWGLATLLALKVVSSPDLSTSSLWVLWGIGLAATARPPGRRP